MLKTIFMGSPSFGATILKALIDSGQSPALVVTQTPKPTGRGQEVVPTPVEKIAQDHHLPVLSTENINAPSIRETLREIQADLYLIVAFGQLLSEELLSLPRLFCLNVHASLLPKYRGAAPIQRALWNGESITGVTIQKMVKKLDAGDMLLKKELSIQPTETAEELTMRLAHLGAQALFESLAQIEQKQFSWEPQNPKVVTYAPKIQKSEAVVDWKNSASFIERQVRALQPWPIAVTTLDNARLRIYQSEIGDKNTAPPGTIVTDHKNFIRVICGNGVLLSLTEIQLENKKRLPVREFLTAYRGHFPYQRLGP